MTHPHTLDRDSVGTSDTLASQRALFQIPDDITYLNCSNMSPKLRRVMAAGVATVQGQASPWTLKPEDWFSGSERLRALAGRILNADAESIALVPGVSYGIAVAAHNVPVQRGQSIVILDQQFPSNVYAWRLLAARREATLRTVRRAPDGTWTHVVLDAIDDSTAIVAVPNCHWTDGSLIDLAAVSAQARAVGAALIVDASQSLGAYPLDVQALQPDFVASVGYKWMLGPYGLSYLYVAPRWREAGEPIEHSWLTRAGAEDFSSLVDYRDEYRPGARRFDMGEFPQLTLTPMAIAALEQILEWDVARIQRSIAVLTQQLADGAARLGCTMLPPAHRVGHIIGIRLSGADRVRAVARALADARVYVSIRGDAMRVAPHLYNTPEDVERFLSVLRATL